PSAALQCSSKLGTLPPPRGGRAIAYASQASRLSSRAQRSTLGRAERDPRVVRCRPGTQVPRHHEKAPAGVLGSRLSLRSAGMTTEETAPYAIALPAAGTGGTSGSARSAGVAPHLLDLVEAERFRADLEHRRGLAPVDARAPAPPPRGGRRDVAACGLCGGVQRCGG